MPKPPQLIKGQGATGLRVTSVDARFHTFATAPQRLRLADGRLVALIPTR